jgi:asparagine synthetase B (glutamine-hydrolysing)
VTFRIDQPQGQCRTLLNDPGNRVLQLDVETFLVNNTLEHTDKMSMAVALEVRMPYLDSRFAERSPRIPFRYKLRGSEAARTQWRDVSWLNSVPLSSAPA